MGLGWHGFNHPAYPSPEPEPWERAIAIRHPWAWAVIHGGKDVENRTAPRQFKAAVGRRIFVHASKGMARAEYEHAVEFMAGLGVRCPPSTSFSSAA